MKILYHIGILFYGASINLVAFCGNIKAKKWINGRKDWKNNIVAADNEDKPIWIHISSLGEYLMTKPLIQLLLDEYKEKRIYLSFFSPSGFENTKIDNAQITKIYLPLDTPANAKYFIKSINPSIAVFAKYDFWFNYLAEIQNQNIPSIVFSTALNKQQIYFRTSWSWHKNILKKISRILVLKEENLSFLHSEGFQNAEVCGDTRFDQVSKLKENTKYLPDIEKFIAGRKCIVLGSSWKDEEEAIANIYNSIENTALIIAPHEVSENRILDIEKRFQEAIRYSSINSNKPSTKKILIIDSIGLLTSIYQLSDIAIVGGGFTGKLHNILEPASCYNAILFGPHYNKFPEASDLISLNAGHSFSNSDELNTILNKLKDDQKLKEIKSIAFKYIKENKGATQLVFSTVKELMNYSTTTASSKI